MDYERINEGSESFMRKYPELFILRHGETVWNAENRMQGALNSPLTTKGEEQAARQRAILSEHDLTGFDGWCSSQARAIQTAAIALGTLVPDIRTDDRLREITVGEWTGLKRDELPKIPGEDPLLAHYEHAPGGEGLRALHDRCVSFLEDLSRPAVIVTHGITSRTLRSNVVADPQFGVANVVGGQGCVFHIKDGVQNLLE